MHHTNSNEPTTSVLATLRALAPERQLSFSEDLRLAELQANRLLELTGVSVPAVPEDVITELPRIEIRYRRLPTSGISYWDNQRRSWIIGINAREPLSRQRFTLFHEYKHIIDHGSTGHLYTATPSKTAAQQAEHVADYFAGCVLMPKRMLKSAWGTGVQKPRDLADVFEVSERAIEVRLAQLGLTEPIVRCAPSSYRASRITNRSRYYRQHHWAFEPVHQQPVEVVR